MAAALQVRLTLAAATIHVHAACGTKEESERRSWQTVSSQPSTSFACARGCRSAPPRSARIRAKAVSVLAAARKARTPERPSRKSRDCEAKSTAFARDATPAPLARFAAQ